MGGREGAAARVAAGENLRLGNAVFGERWLVPWTEKDDATVIAGIIAGLSYVKIRDQMPYRTVASVNARAVRLRDAGRLPDPRDLIAPVERISPEEIGCANLLASMLRYGARKANPKGLPGLGHSAFRELCRRHRIAIPESTLTTKEPAHV